MPRQRFGSDYDLEDKYGYSRALRAGNQVFVSGTTARGEDLDRGAYDQAMAIFAIVGQALERAGASLDDVVRTVIYMTNMDEAPEAARAQAEVLAGAKPTCTIVEVSRLTPPEALVEIQTTAVIGD